MSGAEFERTGPTGAFRDTTSILNDLRDAEFSQEQLQLIFGEKRAMRGFTAVNLNRDIGGGKASLEDMRAGNMGALGEESLRVAAVDMIANDIGTKQRIRGAQANIAGFENADERIGASGSQFRTLLGSMELGGGFGGGLASFLGAIPGVEALVGGSQATKNFVSEQYDVNAAGETNEGGTTLASLNESINETILGWLGVVDQREAGGTGGEPRQVRVAQDAPLQVVVVDGTNPRRETGTE